MPASARDGLRRLVVDLRDQRPVWAIPDWALEEIRAALPAEWEMVVVESEADGRGDGGGPSREALAAVRGAEIYLGFGVPFALFEAATAAPEGRLRWAHSGAAGVRESLHGPMRDSEVLLTNSAGVHARPIAETVIALILHFSRGLDEALRLQREARWEKAFWEEADTPVREAAEVTVGILGFGGIGRATAELARGFGMRVLAWRRRDAGGPDGVELFRGEEGLRSLLAQSDVLVVTLPETEGTRRLLNREALAQLPAGAVFINVSRGNIADEEALLSALRVGRLRGAGLDVFASEPLPPDSPFWSLANVVVTPHVSATSRRFWRRQTDLIVENLRRYLAGEPLLNLVDKDAGY